MRLFCEKQRGSICVFLTLVLVPVLMFSGIMVDASRLFASKTVVSGAGDLTMNAALAQYDKKLKDKYGLTAMAKSPDSSDEQQKLEQMFKESINAKNLKDEKSDDLSSLIQLEETGFEAKGVESSSLAENDVFRQQVMEYMKFRGPVYMADDLLAKIKKLPFNNARKEQKYVKAKSDYALKATELSDPIQKAKAAVEAQADAIEQLGSSDTSFLQTYRDKTVFRLAAKSLQKYINEDIVADFPEEAPDPVTLDEIKVYLSYPFSWDSGNTTFDDQMYKNMVTLLAIYQAAKDDPEVRAAINEENGFTAEEIQTFDSVKSVINGNINSMNDIYSEAADTYQACLKALEQQADIIVDNGKTAKSELDKVLKCWKKVSDKKDAYNRAKDDLIAAGEEVEESPGEDIEINENDLKALKDVIQTNIDTAKTFKEQIKKFKKISKNFEKLSVDDDTAYAIRNSGGASAVQSFWSWHEEEIYDGVTNTQFKGGDFYDPRNETFYQTTLSGVTSEDSDTVQQDQRNQNREEAKAASGSYAQMKETLKNAQKEQNLSEKEGYPASYPSGIAKTSANATGTGPSEIDVSADKKTVQSSKENVELLNSILTCLDNLAGGLMEQGYLMEYTTEMFNCITTKEGDTSLSNDKLSGHGIWNGEIEYILYGNASTGLNKTLAVTQIYGTRLAIDSLYVFMNKDLNREADVVAAAVCGPTCQPWLYPVVKYGYLFCRALAMAAKETVALVNGEESAVWAGKADGLKFTYKDYMKLFILIALTGENGKKDLSARAADCIQLNTGSTLSQKYTMLTLNAKVQTSTTFLPKVPEFLGQGKSTDDGKRIIDYKSVMAY